MHNPVHAFLIYSVFLAAANLPKHLTIPLAVYLNNMDNQSSCASPISIQLSARKDQLPMSNTTTKPAGKQLTDCVTKKPSDSKLGCKSAVTVNAQLEF